MNVGYDELAGDVIESIIQNSEKDGKEILQILLKLLRCETSSALRDKYLDYVSVSTLRSL